MRQRATDADIVIVNHHLFFADLALRGGEYGQVIPDYSAVIFDEAHQVEDVAAEYFGAQVSNYPARRHAARPADASRHRLRRQPRADDAPPTAWRASPSSSGWASRASRAQTRGASRSRRARSRARVAAARSRPTPLGDAYLGVDGALNRLETTLDVLREKPPEVENLMRRIRETRFNLEFIVAGDDRRYVYWVERRGRGTFLRASPIDVSTLLQDKLFDRVETVVLTSATLASAGSFDFIKQRLGLAPAAEEEDGAVESREEKTDELIASSGYDYEEQAVLYLPPRMPDPRNARLDRARRRRGRGAP